MSMTSQSIYSEYEICKFTCYRDGKYVHAYADGSFIERNDGPTSVEERRCQDGKVQRLRRRDPPSIDNMVDGDAKGKIEQNNASRDRAMIGHVNDVVHLRT